MGYDSLLIDCIFSGDITLSGGGTFRIIRGVDGVAGLGRPSLDYTRVLLPGLLWWNGKGQEVGSGPTFSGK